MVRRANENDRPGIGKVYCLGWQEGYKNLMPQSFLDALTPERCGPRTIDPNNRSNYVFESDGEIRGVVNFGTSRDNADDRLGEIRSIYVLPTYWRCSVGRALFSAASAALKEDGYDGFYLWVLKENTRARRFYETMGMRSDGQEKTITIEAVELIEVRYTYLF